MCCVRVAVNANASTDNTCRYNTTQNIKYRCPNKLGTSYISTHTYNNIYAL